MVDCTIEDIEESDVPNSFIIKTPHKSFKVIADSPQEKVAWLNDFRKVMQYLYQHGITDQWELDHIFSQAPIMTPNNRCNKCTICGLKFNLFHRKYHCKKCGKIACRNCSNYRIFLPNISLDNKARVCVACYIKITTKRTSSIAGIYNLPIPNLKETMQSACKLDDSESEIGQPFQAEILYNTQTPDISPSAYKIDDNDVEFTRIEPLSDDTLESILSHRRINILNELSALVLEGNQRQKISLYLENHLAKRVPLKDIINTNIMKEIPDYTGCSVDQLFNLLTIRSKNEQYLIAMELVNRSASDKTRSQFGNPSNTIPPQLEQFYSQYHHLRPYIVLIAEYLFIDNIKL